MPSDLSRGASWRLAGLVAALFTGFAAYHLGVAADAGFAIPDDAVSLYEAEVHASGMLFGRQPPVEPDSFRMSMVLDGEEGRRYGKDYFGFPLILAVGVRAGAAWLVNPLLGGLVVLGTFLLGRGRAGNAGGVAAAALVASSATLFKVSGSYLNHVAFLVLMLACAEMLRRAIARGGASWAFAAGLAFGWSLATRPFDAALFALPFALVLGEAAARRGAVGRRQALAFGLGTVPWVVAMIAWNHALTGDPWVTPYQHWRPDNFPGLPGQTRADHDLQRSLSQTTDVLSRFLRTSFVVPWLPLAALALPLAVARRLGRREVLLGLAVLLPVLGYAFYPGIGGVSARFAGGRFYCGALPALATLLAAGGAALVRGLGVWPKRVAFALPLALFGFALVESYPATISATATARTEPLRRGNRLLSRYLDGLPLERRLVFVDASTFEHAAALLETRPDFEGRDVVAIYWEPEANRRVMDAFPDRAAYLFRMAAGDSIEFAPYDPATDSKGPPNRFPYDRWRNRARASAAPAGPASGAGAGAGANGERSGIPRK